MFLSSLDAYIVIPVIVVVVAQYAFALFCLMKLAYLDISRKNYVLWNLLILVVFFIGGAAFLIYYSKHPELKIEKTSEITDAAEHAGDPEATSDADPAESESADVSSGSEGEVAQDKDEPPRSDDE